jgi:hypothetical protein
MKNTIEIPIDISTKGLSLEHIATIVVMMTYPHLKEEDKKKYDTDEFNDKVQELAEMGILSVKDGEFIIDLEDKDRPFFEIEDYDEFDNPIYYAMSPFCSDDDFCGSPFYWRVKPILCDLKILWKNVSDGDIKTPIDEEIFDSLEEAEKYFKEQNKRILENGDDE